MWYSEEELISQTVELFLRRTGSLCYRRDSRTSLNFQRHVHLCFLLPIKSSCRDTSGLNPSLKINADFQCTKTDAVRSHVSHVSKQKCLVNVLAQKEN